MLRTVGALSTVVLLLFVVALYALQPEPVGPVELVFPVLTIVFLASSSTVVTYVAVKAYSREGLFSVLFLGCGALVFGSSSLLAAIFLGSEGQNFSATIFATGAATSGALHFVCAFLTYRGSSPKPARRAPILWVSLTFFFVVLVVVGALGGVFPAFYASASGTTSLDRVVLGLASVMFASSTAVMFAVYSSSKSEILYWYSLALAATAVGLVGIAYSNGDLDALPMRAGWATVYLGGILLAASVYSAQRLGGLPSGRDGNSPR